MLIVLFSSSFSSKVNAERVPDSSKHNSLLNKSIVNSNTEDIRAFSLKHPNKWVSDQTIYIDDNGTITTIPIDTLQDFKIVGWSPNNQYVYILESSQYYGGQRGHLVDVKSQSVVYSFYTLTNDITWVKPHSFVYFDPKISCKELDFEKCLKMDVGVIQYNIKESRGINEYTILEQESKYPLVKLISVKNSTLEFKLTYDYINQDFSSIDSLFVNLSK